MTKKANKVHRSKILTPKRFTFTFSNTPELNIVVQSLEERLSGLNRAEIVKLALVEYNNYLKKQEKFTDTIIRLSRKEEESLAKAMKSKSILVDKKKKGELEKFLNKVKRGHV